MITPSDEQNNAIMLIKKWFKSKPSNPFVLGGYAGCGKAQPLNSKILTKNGYIQMKDVYVGCEIFGDDGKIYEISNIFKQGIKDVYDITFSDNIIVRCCDDHLWNVHTKQERDLNRPYKTKSIREIIESHSLFFVEKNGYKKWNCYIPMCLPLQFSEQSVFIDPYIFGLLIGDGSFRSSISFINYEVDIIERLKKFCNDNGFILTKKGRAVYIKDDQKIDKHNRITSYIKELGLFNSKSETKFIPKVYLYNSIQNRIDLLSGLIDTDGEVINENYFYSTTSLQLANDVKFLVNSLGGTCNLNSRQTYFTYNGVKKPGLKSYRLGIKLPKDIKCFRSDKHTANFRVGQTQSRRTIRKIEYVGREECVCITTTNPSKLYLTDDCVVTHNSSIIPFIIDSLKLDIDDVHFCTFTGKASLVLCKKGLPATTIHRLLYLPKEDKNGKLIFTRNPYMDKNLKLIIVDEASTVDIKLKYDLESHNIPILYIGDCFQLPPVSKDQTNIMLNPNFILTKIFRQAQENPIITIAHMIRSGKNISLGRYGDSVLKTTVDKMKDDWLINADQVLCGKNVTRHSLNSAIRRMGGIDDKYPVVGDKIICLKNNNDNGLINGMLGICKAFSEHSWEMNFENDDSEIWNNLKIEKKVFDKDNEIVYSKEVEMMDYGSVITVHKCLVGNTMLLSDKGMVTLNDLDNNSQPKTFNEINGIYIYNGSIMENPSHFYNNGLESCKKITTNKGFYIEGTYTHKMDVLTANGIEVKYIKDICDGDVMILSKGSNIYGNNIELEYSCRINYDTRTKIYDIPTIITKDFARLLGYMVADGTLTKKGIKFSKRHKEVTENFVEVISNIFGYDGKISYRKSGDYMCEIGSIHIADFLSNFGGISPHNKYVPECILQASKEIQCEFLKCMFEDGTVNIKKNKNGIYNFDHIELSSSNEICIHQIHMMLLNMGIISTLNQIQSYDKKYSTIRIKYNLNIYGNNAYIFSINIGFISKFKNDRLQLVNENIICGKDTIPYVNRIIKNICNTHDIVLSKRHKQMISFSNIGYNRLEEILKVIGSSINVYDSQYTFLCGIIDNGLFFDRVKTTEDTLEQTYCITMPKTHKFIQNGFHGWNSQGSQFDKVVVFEETLGRDEEMHRRWLYTAITRAISKLIIIGR